MIDAAVIAKIQRSQRSRANRQAGVDSEALIRQRLISIGCLFIERIEVGWKILRDFKTRRIINAVPMAKVSGDFRAVSPRGRSILVEGKRRSGSLLYSTLEDHQHQALDHHRTVGGISLVAWQSESDIFILLWPIPGFAPRKSIDVETARALSLRSLQGVA